MKGRDRIALVAIELLQEKVQLLTSEIHFAEGQRLLAQQELTRHIRAAELNEDPKDNERTG